MSEPTDHTLIFPRVPPGPRRCLYLLRRAVSQHSRSGPPLWTLSKWRLFGITTVWGCSNAVAVIGGLPPCQTNLLSSAVRCVRVGSCSTRIRPLATRAATTPSVSWKGLKPRGDIHTCGVRLSASGNSGVPGDYELIVRACMFRRGPSDQDAAPLSSSRPQAPGRARRASDMQHG